jgi:hypothetical protein
MSKSDEWWMRDDHPDAAEHRKHIEQTAKEAAERALALVPTVRTLPAPRRKKKAKSGPSLDEFEQMGRLTAKAIKDATAPLEKRLAELEASPTKYVGTWVAGTNYPPRTMASWGGSIWHANEETTEKPGTGPAWTLAVKRGRDGKDAKP